VRRLRKNPGFTAVAVVTLALGIGANTTIFSVLNALVLRSLPVRDPSRLVQIYTARHGRWAGITVAQIEEIERLQKVLSGVFGRVYPNNSYVEAGGTLWPINLGYVTGQYYSVLGVLPLFGRLISPADVGLPEGAPTPVAVLSYEFWQRRYAGGRNIIGRTLLIAKVPFTVIGVTPEGFFGEQVGFSLDVTIPITEKPGRSADPQEVLRCQYAIGRLRDGIGIEQARAQLERLWPAIRSETATATAGPHDSEQGRALDLEVLPYPENGFSFLRERFSKPLSVLVAIAALILLIACVNLANLLLARAFARRQVIAIRVALGAGRRLLIRQLLTESMLLSGCGAGVGLGFAYRASGWLVRFWAHIPFNPVTALNVAPDLRVLGFATGIALLTGILFGLAPAWYASQQPPTSPMQEASRASGKGFRRFGKLLIGVQVALSLVLVAVGGLLIRSFENLRAFDPGFSYRHVLFLQLEPRVGAPRLMTRAIVELSPNNLPVYRGYVLSRSRRCSQAWFLGVGARQSCCCRSRGCFGRRQSDCIAQLFPDAQNATVAGPGISSAG